ncbi:MAG: hypothetical protein U5L45_09990 [Saprospiraceae bacterium]|nr:hypothetical protein [Saprospiraceae bacterium]
MEKKIEGKLVERRGDTVVVESTSLDTLNIHIKNIKSISELDDAKINLSKYLYDENKHAVHGFFAPTGFGLRKGEGYYKNFYLFVNHLNYGFTDNFSLEFSTETLSLFASGGTSPFQLMYVVPKLSYPVAQDVNIGVGMYIARLASNLGNGAVFGIPFGVATYGNRDNNLSAGLGKLLIANANPTYPFVFSLSGQLRFAKNFGLVTDNYLFKFSEFNGDEPIVLNSIGIRYIGKSFSFDLGASFSLIEDASFILPALGFSVPFGRNK